jgi:fatty-acyl-CoA synthase
MRFENKTTDPVGNRDSPLKMWVRALDKVAFITRNPAVTLPVVVDALADKFGDRLALLFDQESLTFRALAERTHRYSRWALEQGLTNGAVVCLLMPNCPEYLAIWLGITRVGGVVALINTNLSDDSLAHAINVVAPRHIIAAGDLVNTLATVLPKLAPEVQCGSHGENFHRLPRVDLEIDRHEGRSLTNSEYRRPSLMDRALYIYTSGTTGLPKAASVSHFRLMQWSYWFAGMMDTRPEDRMYDCLPMYHSVGGVVAIGATLVNGGSVVLRERFSASHFWDDVVELKCTLVQYIGELCRYLVNSSPHPRESEHQLRLACGNGLRPDVWNEFKRRFHIPVLEFYAATEANLSLYNCEEQPGAIGRIPSFLAHRSSVALIQIDPETEEPIRGGEGFCTRCSANETGEAIGKILDDGSSPESRFEGYSDLAASEKKLLRDVFVKGDAWFRTGDLMRRDEKGFFYFVDRIGDTFRWKGENVSTTEVADTILECPGVIETVVYGVKVEGADGRVGMVAAVVSSDFDLMAFRKHLIERLPEYARPLFLRILQKIEMTETFKAKKRDLSREAFDPAANTDAVYFNEQVRQAFVRLDGELYEKIQTGKVRL